MKVDLKMSWLSYNDFFFKKGILPQQIHNQIVFNI